MQLSYRAIASFKQVYFKQYGVELTEVEAQEKAYELLQFMKLVYRQVKTADKAILESYKTA